MSTQSSWQAVGGATDTVVKEAPVDYYEILGVDINATMPDIKAAYRAVAALGSFTS